MKPPHRDKKVVRITKLKTNDIAFFFSVYTNRAFSFAYINKCVFTYLHPNECSVLAYSSALQATSHFKTHP